MPSTSETAGFPHRECAGMMQGAFGIVRKAIDAVGFDENRKAVVLSCMLEIVGDVMPF